MSEAKVLFERAKELQHKQHLDEAIDLYRRAVLQDPDYVEAHNNLGNALAATRRHEEAVASLRRATELRPDLAPIHSNLGLALVNLQRFEEAEQCFRRALELQPDLAAAHGNLAIALRQLGKWNEAIDHYRLAIALKPGAAEFHLNLGTALVELDRPQEAAESFRRAIEADPGLARAHLELADALHDLGQFESAQRAYARAIELDGGLARAHASQGRALLELGRKSEALESLERAIAADPFAGGAHLTRLSALEGRLDDADVARLESALADSAKLSTLDRSMFHFALATAYEAMGRFDEAFANASTANQIRRPLVKYDEAALARRLDRMREVFTARLLAEKRTGGCGSDLPIFVVGLARSGSTLIEQILASHPQVQGGGERPILDKLLAGVRMPDGSVQPYPDFVPALTTQDLRLLGESYVAKLSGDLPPAGRVVDKYLSNYAHVGLIRLILPNARILHTMRDPLDTCVSAYCLSFIGNAQAHSYELAELGRHYRRYAEMMDHWRRALPEGAMLDVRYESLVDDPEAGVRRLLDYCGLPWDPRCLSFHETRRRVQTASLAQVRQKLYGTSVGRWRRYEAHLAPLIEALGDHAVQRQP